MYSSMLRGTGMAFLIQMPLAFY